jgi:hypothetical protein
VQAFYKLFDSPITAGRLPLRIHITNLSGLPATCQYRDLRASNAQARLQQMLQEIVRVYRQINITLDPITFVDSAASPSVDANRAGSLTGVLRAASEQTSGGADLVLVRSITPNGVLGIAGGIPASPGLKGSPHTGAVAAMYPLCLAQYTQMHMAATIAHELGHTLGLSHNREANGQSDPLGDGSSRSESYLQGTANLMFYAESNNPGSRLTSEQGEVVRSMPQVLP